MVAKTYANYKVEGEPFNVKGKPYVNVRSPKGILKQVRYYTEAEYNKMYPAAKVAQDATRKSQREVLGFGTYGYINIVKGDADNDIYHSWRVENHLTYTRWWGWYLRGDQPLPEIPDGLSFERLFWASIGNEDGSLKPEKEVTNAVDAILCDPGTSEWCGNVGERLTFTLTCTGAYPIEGAYGTSTLHIFEDASGNAFQWLTASKKLEIGESYELKGTVKEHTTYKNNKVTVLTRCAV